MGVVQLVLVGGYLLGTKMEESKKGKDGFLKDVLIC
jgi:hypothetical protein